MRFLVLSGPIFLTAAIAGPALRHGADALPDRPRLPCVGVSLLLMRGIEPGDDWTHLIPGFIVAGIGAGLVNVPLASTAVGVVEPARAGHGVGDQLDVPPGRASPPASRRSARSSPTTPARARGGRWPGSSTA